jgi:hypothetical protein
LMMESVRSMAMVFSCEGVIFNYFCPAAKPTILP